MTQYRKPRLWGAIIVSLFGAALLTVQAQAQSQATSQAQDFRHLETIGSSQLLVQADMAELKFSVVTKAKTSAQAKAESDKALANLIEKLQQMGVNRQAIDSANLNLSADYLYDPTTRQNNQIGYQASRQLTLQLRQLDRLNDILDLALEQGINRIGQINFKSSRYEELQEKARQLAIQDARQKAQSLATGFGETLGQVWEIRYLPQSPTTPVHYRMEAAAKADIGASYQEAQITIRDSVEVIYRLE
ncbi:SIMPL domain-containing protein [Shewanella sp. AS1]|uniref:SIMPL domain-containing protein n=1 Tax=Shewanella sp. AS1 TaxID=2907626 RepID=UPI001F468A48|nr:SIMPL domain-containing protein [Shewanella sp. AS1]MCE9679321.1 SIMPL domain-containing protein [Shewanella sp. AS1]